MSLLLTSYSKLVFIFSFFCRFRLKVDVSDGDEVATFVIFDTDCQNILKKTCRELVICSKVITASYSLQVLI